MHFLTSFCSGKTTPCLYKGIGNALNSYICPDVLPASNQGLCMAVLVQCSRCVGVPGISQKSFSKPEPRKCPLRQVWQSVAYVLKTIQRQIPSDTLQWKHKASTQLEASTHRKKSVSHSLVFPLEDSMSWRGWWVHPASHWDVAGVLPMLHSTGYPVEVPRLRDGHSRCVL